MQEQKYRKAGDSTKKNIFGIKLLKMKLLQSGCLHQNTLPIQNANLQILKPTQCHNTKCALFLLLFFVQNQDVIPDDFGHIPLVALLVIIRPCFVFSFQIYGGSFA